ncbi:FAD-dependent oxidoreductase [Aminobacter sp. AP02]|uniref:NAD(P)/FAD-dependent oxidoreductase n=1 Tax=Aminobacter sp. AP02 TaxID=2135737 RepID=UPI000D6A9029|nr:FAD-dependent oxidoreductase [Aminobacter sp. AP02]PWK61772.1 3-phenylpropionate/trans-cinnamate dioxygenase ferredoxin reductase subunit [Aminobacter sp. AP02]
MEERCIIVGAGHAGSQAAVSLRQEGYLGEIILIDDEADIPYHKPPLSKAYLKAPDASSLVLRPEAVYRDNSIELLLGAHVSTICVDDRKLALSDGRQIGWTDLILATGARARIPDLVGVGARGVVSLRSIADARLIRDMMAGIDNVVIVGGGFIGMEMAHSCSVLGKKVTLIEAAPRVLGRSVAEVVSTHVKARSRAAGIDVFTGVQVAAFEEKDGRIEAVRTVDGRRFEAEMVVLGVGAVPNVELAIEAGLAVDNGIVVDSHLRSSAPHVYAIGDCAIYNHHHVGRRIRLESVQNATDQARHVARSIAGRPGPYRDVAWFWSDQGDMKLQTAGLSFDADRHFTSGNPEENAFSVYHFQGTRLLAVDSVNRPADHMIARRLLAAGVSPTEADIAAGPQHLKQLASEKQPAPA